ncbi:MAG: substrate-binding domain-containing protein [Planctomycetales bacterium]|nr:substrate-binding domain-containing protein [Planctomycetales bacterium]
MRTLLLSRLVSLAMLCSGILLVGCNTSGNSTSKGSAGGKELRVILLTNGDDPFWDAMRSGMEKAAEDFGLDKNNLKVEMDKNDGTSKGQIDKLKQYAGQTDIAAVAISVTDADNNALARAMKDLAETGVKVITIDSDVNREKYRDSRIAYLGTDNVIGGRELGKAARGLRPDGGIYATFYGLAAAANVIERTSGFAEGAGDTFTKADSLSDNMDLTKALANVRNSLENNPNINTLVGIWAYNAHAIAEAVKEKGVREKTTVVVFDAAPKAIQHMNDGNIDAMIVQNPYQMGYLGTKLMQALHTGDENVVSEMFPNLAAGEDTYVTELRVVVPSSDSPLKPEMFDSNTKFFTAQEFNAWLQERGLQGS